MSKYLGARRFAGLTFSTKIFNESFYKIFKPHRGLFRPAEALLFLSLNGIRFGLYQVKAPYIRAARFSGGRHVKSHARGRSYRKSLILRVLDGVPDRMEENRDIPLFISLFREIKGVEKHYPSISGWILLGLLNKGINTRQVFRSSLSALKSRNRHFARGDKVGRRKLSIKLRKYAFRRYIIGEGVERPGYTWWQVGFSPRRRRSEWKRIFAGLKRSQVWRRRKAAISGGGRRNKFARRRRKKKSRRPGKKQKALQRRQLPRGWSSFMKLKREGKRFALPNSVNKRRREGSNRKRRTALNFPLNNITVRERRMHHLFNKAVFNLLPRSGDKLFVKLQFYINVFRWYIKALCKLRGDVLREALQHPGIFERLGRRGRLSKKQGIILRHYRDRIEYSGSINLHLKFGLSRKIYLTVTTLGGRVLKMAWARTLSRRQQFKKRRGRQRLGYKYRHRNRAADYVFKRIVGWFWGTHHLRAKMLFVHGPRRGWLAYWMRNNIRYWLQIHTRSHKLKTRFWLFGRVKYIGLNHPHNNANANTKRLRRRL